MSTSQLTAVTESTFDKEVLESDLPVLVDFWAPWCGPCKAIAPLLSELSTEYTGKIKFVKVNTDENPKLANAYKIQGIPTLSVFHKGTAADSLVGAVPKTTLKEFLDRYAPVAK